MKEITDELQRQTFYLREDQAVWLMNAQLQFRRQLRARVGVSELVRAAIDLAREELEAHTADVGESKLAQLIPCWKLTIEKTPV